MAGGVYQPSTSRLLLSAATFTATGFSTTFALPEAECYSLYLVATAASGTTPNLNAIVQTSVDGGTNWVNLPLVFASVTAAGTSGPLIFKPTMGIGASGVAPTITAGTAQATNTPLVQNQLRLSNTITGTTPSFTVNLFAICVPKGGSTV